jgi:geranylgeranyl reductase family protein
MEEGPDPPPARDEPPVAQRAVDDRTPSRWDVVVVGAGPAGALAARRLAARGHAVLLLDRRRFPRDKTCGDALIPDAQAALARNGLLERVRALAWRSECGEIHAPSGARVEVRCPSLTVPRRLLDATLAAAAVEAGAHFVHGAVTSVVDDTAAGAAGGATIHVEGRAAPLRARLALVATGAHVGLLADVGLLKRQRASAVAIRCYLRSRAVIDRLVVSFDRAILPGYAWIFPVGRGGDGAYEYNVGCGVVLGDGDGDAPQRALRAMLERFLAQAPAGRALVREEVGRGAVRGALLRTGLTGARGWGGGAVLAIGEAVGATFPLTGEGIGKAMETAELASDAADAALRDNSNAPLGAYPQALAARLRPRYRGYEVAQRWIGRPWLADLVLGRAARRAPLREALTGILTETVDPARVFSLGGLARALVG